MEWTCEKCWNINLIEGDDLKSLALYAKMNGEWEFPDYCLNCEATEWLEVAEALEELKLEDNDADA